MTKIVFFGTPDFVLPVLENLHSNFEVVAVVTQPPKPVGRKQILTPSSVAVWAQQKGIQIFDGSPKEILQPIKELGAIVAVVAAYGKIIPGDLLNIFPSGMINVHFSLLPRYRGASPVEAAIASGDEKTGITIIKLDKGLDTGPIIHQSEEPILENDTKETLRTRLFKKTAKILVEILPSYLDNKIELKPQDNSKATYTTLIEKEHGFIPPEYVQAALDGKTLDVEWPTPFIKGFVRKPSPSSMEHFIRALSPWPTASTEVAKNDMQHTTKRIKLLKAHIEDGKLVLDQVQLEGKNQVSWKQFKEGYPKAKF
ncbi:MAG: methionyl-tRNA formyltransferase [Candidatus Blackburnbacteria bacterium RIFCSPHIGHO2_01_FULL_40_17]|nr:MAG: methionyl-tRNA formyltransferase [Candidatus Blackburnbacteria bacterium RIFCSPHIGHO2_01_FULL_40_17]